MTVAEKLELALEFMLLGMGLVFSFLVLLVLIVKLTSNIIIRMEDRNAVSVNAPDPALHSQAVELDETITAVISAAVYQYRKQLPPGRN